MSSLVFRRLSMDLHCIIQWFHSKILECPLVLHGFPWRFPRSPLGGKWIYYKCSFDFSLFFPWFSLSLPFSNCPSVAGVRKVSKRESLCSLATRFPRRPSLTSLWIFLGFHLGFSWNCPGFSSGVPWIDPAFPLGVS